MVSKSRENTPPLDEHDNDYKLFLEEIKRLENLFKRQTTKNIPHITTTYRPFEHIRDKIKEFTHKKSVKIPAPSEPLVEKEPQPQLPQKASAKIHRDELELFLSEIGEVRKIEGPEKIPNRPEKKFTKNRLAHITELEIRDISDYSRIYQNAFSLEYSAEYVEWIASDVDKGLAKRLHRGEFSVQEYLDLHGYFLNDALDACNNFLTKALNENKRCIAIIHGRGLSSSNGPVLKDAVIKWLKKGPFRRFILCFVTAPQTDGGFGVTYILLRKNKAR